MSGDTYLDAVRLLNAVLASLVFCGLVYKGRLYYKSYNGQQKSLWLSFTTYALAAAYGSVESYSQNVGFGWRIIILLFANMCAIYAFARYPDSAFKAKSDGR